MEDEFGVATGSQMQSIEDHEKDLGFYSSKGNYWRVWGRAKDMTLLKS